MASTNRNPSSQVIHIRPYQVLAIPDGFSDEFTFYMPEPQARGSLKAIESIMLVKLMRVVNPPFLFEFGTYKGLTTRLLLSNLPGANIHSERIFTLDITDLSDINFIGSDIELAKEFIYCERKYILSPNSHLVKQLLQDSITFDGKLYEKKFSLIFIDGNHEISYAKRDTENAFVMLADAPSVIIWHDYENQEFPEVTSFIDNLSKQVTIYHIEETMLTFYLVGMDVAPRNR